MRLFKLIISIAAVTGFALLYVHQQVELVKLSYAIESKEKTVKDMLDLKEGLGYTINNLEAPSRLEGILLSKNIDIAFPKQGHVVKIAKATSGIRGDGHIRNMGMERKAIFSGFLDFFGAGREAQAREK